MTLLLDKAIKALRLLPPAEQDAFAREMLDRLASDQRWESLLADPRSLALLDQLSQEALAEVATGEFREGDPSDLAKG